jgi:hypothetical protein
MKKGEIKGFKGFNYCPRKKKLNCNPTGMHPFYFHLKKKNIVEGKIELCANGIHFCGTLKSVFSYYTPNYYSFFAKVIASGTTTKRDNLRDKYATSHLLIEEVIPNSEVLKEFGFRATGGAKEIKNLKESSMSDLIFEDLKTYQKYFDLNKTATKIKATIVYYKKEYHSGSYRLVKAIH